MHHWKAIVEIALQVVTILVLLITWLAIRRQADASEKQARASEAQATAADKLTKATEQQIKASEEQAKATREQVDVAKRQITESLRPILVWTASQTIPNPNGSLVSMEIQNLGAGTALNAWWSYGNFGDPSMTLERHRVQGGIIPPMRPGRFQVKDSLATQKGIVIVYSSLSGMDSATTLRWDGREWVPDYIPDAGEWTKSLLGKPLGPSSAS
jgi:hypothetical protein